jgi:hypothetical protein
MTTLKLIESTKQIKNVVEIVATVETEDNEVYLGKSTFLLLNNEILPEDEDDLYTLLDDMDLIWEKY